MVKKALFFLILSALTVLFMLTKPTPHIWSYDKIQMQIPSTLEVHDTFIYDTTGKIAAEIEPSDFDMEILKSEFGYSSEKECSRAVFMDFPFICRRCSLRNSTRKRFI